MDLVVCNAFPKCGTHALQKACRLLGLTAETAHRPFREGPPSGRHIFIRRDPRDALCSSLQAHGGPVTQGLFIEALANWSHMGSESRPFIPSAREFTGWLSASDVLVVSYEALTRSDAELRRIAEWAEVPYLEDAFPNLPGHTVTWRLPHADYAQVWTDPVREAWSRAGGDALLKDWGYG